MRFAGVIGPRRARMIVALGANVDPGIVEFGECAVGRHEVVVRGRDGIAQLRGI